MLVKSKLTGQQYMFPDDMDQGQIAQAIRQAEADQEVPDYSPMGRRVPLREYLQGLGESAQAFGRQATSAMLGLPGEIESLVRLQNPLQAGRFASGQPLESTLPQTDDIRPFVDKIADDLVGEQTSKVIGEGGKEAFEFMGDVMAPLGIQPTKQAIDLARKAPVGLLNMMAEAPQGPRSQLGAIGVRVQNDPSQEISVATKGNLGPGVYLYEKDTPDLADKLISRGMQNKITRGGEPYSLELEYDDNLNLYETSKKVLSDAQVQQIKDAGFDGVRRVVDGVPQEVNIFDPKNVRFPSAGLLDEIPEDPLYKFSNINEEYIPTIEELGGLPSPSIGIGKADYPVSSFGEIGLIGRIGSFENDPTFAADIYSPRQPRPDIDIPEKNILAEQDRLKKQSPDIVKNYGLPRFDISSDPFDAARYEPAFVAEFAELKGIDVSPEAQTTETAKFLDMKSTFGSDLEQDLGVSDALTRQALKYFARQLPPKPPEDASEIRKRKYRNRVQAYKEFFTDGQLNDLGYAVLKSEYDAEKAKSEFDRSRVMRNIKDQFREQGIEQEFEQFLKEKVNSMNPRKKLFDQDYFQRTGNRRNLEYNMDNILKIMTKKDTRGGEGFGGTGGTRALVTPRLKNLNEIKDNRGRIVTSDEFSDASDIIDLKTGQLMLKIREAEGLPYFSLDDFLTQNQIYFTGQLDAYIKGEKHSEIFKLNNESKQAVDEYLKELADMPTEYFEAKPQRAVELSEFYGAVVPKGTSRKVTAPLENAGLKIEYYDPEKGRSQAIKNLHKKSGGDILFSAGGIALLTASQIEDEEQPEL